MKTSTLKIFLFTAITLFMCNYSLAQIGVSGYSTFAIGVNTSQDNDITGELKMFTNRKFEDLAFEIDVFYNFVQADNHRFAAGLGVNVSPFIGSNQFNSVALPVMFQFYPIPDNKSASILFELAPQTDFDDYLGLRHIWGIRYTFN